MNAWSFDFDCDVARVVLLLGLLFSLSLSLSLSLLAFDHNCSTLLLSSEIGTRMDGRDHEEIAKSMINKYGENIATLA